MRSLTPARAADPLPPMQPRRHREKNSAAGGITRARRRPSQGRRLALAQGARNDRRCAHVGRLAVSDMMRLVEPLIPSLRRYAGRSCATPSTRTTSSRTAWSGR